MPQMPDAAVIVSGQVMNVIPIIGRDGDDKGKNLGFTAHVIAPDETGVVGLSVVKIKRDKDTNLTAIDAPALMENVAWVVKSAPYSVDGNSGMSTQFVRLLSSNDLDKLISYSGLALTSK
jgi:hypothetical protein